MAKKTEKKNSESEVDVWGYGFRPEGAKWMAYKASTKGLEELSPPGGELLWRVKERLFGCIQREVVSAQRGRAA